MTEKERPTRLQNLVKPEDHSHNEASHHEGKKIARKQAKIMQQTPPPTI